MKLIPLFALFIIIGGVLSGQVIDSKKQELDSLREEIRQTEILVKQKKQQEKETLNTIDLYTRQSYLLGVLLSELNGQLQSKAITISSLTNQIDFIQNKMDSLRERYRAYVVAVYKGIPDNQWVYIFSSNSFSEAAYRFYVLKRITNNGKKALTQLKSAKDNLRSVSVQLITEKKNQELMVNDKNQEEKLLKVKIKERKTLLNKIKKDNAALKKDLVTKKQNEKLISNLINKLIVEEARKKKERDEELARRKKKEEELAARTEREKTVEPKTKEKTKVTPDIEEKPDYYDMPGNTEFTKLKGKLMWPVREGVVIRKFGENKNEKLKTVTLNYGVDIKSKADAEVVSVHDGIISVIDWLPGYGSVVIVTHSQDYRTVYGHMSNINIKEGEKVKKGKVLGRVGESIEGYLLHFQIWNDRDNQNPEIWLARK